ncbi:DUF6731 family protein [Pontibacillus salicampi]|uniref:DUF6731 family protein n=1 Tax=Pontibacillus salicampi TaxID=1449801 RepID=A0ABV6LTQ9_9BACI
MPKKNVRFDYFKVWSDYFNETTNMMEQSLTDLTEAIKAAQSIDVSRRILVVGDDVARLQNIKFNNNKWELHFMRIRKQGFPVRTKDDGTVNFFDDMEDDEGLGEEVSALYDPQTHVIMIRRNMFSLSPSAIANFFTTIVGGPGFSIYFKPLVHPRAMELIQNDHLIRGATVYVSDVKNAKSRTKFSLGRLTNKTEDINESVNYSIKISLNQKGSKKNSNIPIYEELQELEEDANVESIEVRTKANEDAKVEYVDLVKHRLTDFNVFTDRDFDNNFRNIVHETVIAKMQQLYRTRVDEIKNTYV